MKQINFEKYQLSKLSFGTVQLGLDYGISNIEGKPTQRNANEIINYLIGQGIDSFDTAVAYGNSEEVLGNALERQRHVHVISKIKSNLFIDNVEYVVRDSLERLKSDKLFALLLHDCEVLKKWNTQDTKRVKSLQDKELIEYFGISIYTTDEFDMAIENSSIQVIQIPFNIFDQRAVNNDWFKRAKETNKLIFIRSVFLQGLFFMKNTQLRGNLVAAIPYLTKLHTLRKELKLTISECALSYVDSVASEAILLFGCDTLEQAKENIESYNNLPKLDSEIVMMINKTFLKVPTHIIDPSEWSK